MEKFMTAYEYGKHAFEQGKKRIPAHDDEFLAAHIAGKKVGEGISDINEWLRGWDEANLRD